MLGSGWVDRRCSFLPWWVVNESVGVGMMGGFLGGWCSLVREFVLVGVDWVLVF